MEITINKMKTGLPFVSIITVNYNGRQLLKDCFDSLLALNYPRNRLEIFMVDNCSQDDSLEFVKEHYPPIKVIRNNINNYCKANNLGISKSKGEYVAILNNDTKVEKNWLIELIKAITVDCKIGAAGSKVLFMDGKIQSVGHVEFPNYYWADKGFLEEDRQQYNKIKKVQSISNCSALYRREALNKVGLFDEDFGMYMEDVDMAFRLRKKGWVVLYVPESVAYHRLGGSQQKPEEKQFYIEKNRLLFMAKHFPDKLPEFMMGFGEITRLKHNDFQKILVAICKKLVEQRGASKAKDILIRLQKSIEMVDEYRQYTFREAVERTTLDIQQQLLSRDEQTKAQQELIRATQKESQTKDEQNQNLSRELKSKEEQIKAQQELIQNLQRESQAKDTQGHSLLNELRAREEQIKVQQELTQNLQRESQAKDTQSQSLLNELRAREEQIKTQQELIQNLQRESQAKDTQGHSLLNELRAREEQIKVQQELTQSLQRESQVREVQNQNLLNELRIRQEQIKSQQELIQSLQKESQAKGEQRWILLKILKIRNEQIKTQQNLIQSLQKESQAKEEEIRVKEKIISEKSNEILKIYDSQTFRFFVRPIIWPFFSFIKRIGNIILLAINFIVDTLNSLVKIIVGFIKCVLYAIRFILDSLNTLVKATAELVEMAIDSAKEFLHFIRNLKTKETGISIAQLSAKNTIAKYLQNNEYIIKLVNNNFKEKKVRLVMDIWPYKNRIHPERHFAYFVIETVVKPKNSNSIKIVYDWDKNIHIFEDNRERQLFDFWRSGMKNPELYIVKAHVRNLEGKNLHTLNILQKLE